MNDNYNTILLIHFHNAEFKSLKKLKSEKKCFIDIYRIKLIKTHNFHILTNCFDPCFDK